MQGFLSGMNAMQLAMPGGKAINLPDAAAVRTMVDSACRDDPAQNLAGAGMAAMIKLVKR
ncbi:hypothetical protein D3C71_2096280 [compost metagenome]